ALAEALARSDPRLRYLRLPINSGAAGRPRNEGIDATRAPYVMFLDSDDELEPHACADLLRAVRETDAELASGLCVRVLVQDGHAETPWYPRLYRERLTYDDVAERPGLLFDTNSTNKIYRRSFLERTGLRYPEGRTYEDLLFTTAAYCLARRITLTPERVYRWYVDERADRLSVTNRRAELANLAARLSIHRDIDAWLLAHGRAALKVHKDVKFLQHDLRLYLGDLPRRDPAYQQEFLDQAGDYLAGLTPEGLDLAGTMLRVAAYLVRAHDLDGVLAVSAWLGQRQRLTIDLVADGDQVFWGERHLDTPEGRHALDVTDLGLADRPLSKLHLQTTATSVAVDGSALTVRGRTRNQLDKVGAGSAELALILTARGSHRQCAVPMSEICHRGRSIAWGASVPVADLLGVIEADERVWDVALRIRVGEEVALATVLVDGVALPGGLPVRVRRRLLAGDTLVPYATVNGNLALRLVASRPSTRVVRALTQRLLHTFARRPRRRG
ncbi:MAG TPA: glycosyltransferase family 2 protein, partial [Actinomycetes bacterium]|nr:glycosyltransferase family 2 protein [Actinomycetes bacterium]